MYAAFEDYDEATAEIWLIDDLLTMSPADASRFDSVYFDCMKQAGFDIPLEVRPIRTAPTRVETDADVELEVASIEEIAAAGYQIGQGGTSEDIPLTEADPLSAWIAALAPEQQEAYQIADLGPDDGPKIQIVSEDAIASLPSSGCNYEGLRAAHGDVERWFTAATQLTEIRLDMGAEVASSETYQQAVDEWSHCMSNHGYQVDDPDNLDGPVEQALADRTCRDEAGLRTARREAQLRAANARRDDIGSLAATAAEIRESAGRDESAP